jgi:dienelactone hydrolase
MSPCKTCASLTLLCLLAAAPSAAQAAGFKFRSEVAEKIWSATIGGSLTFPRGAGPFPAAVLLHPCGGLSPGAVRALQGHAGFLNGNGFAAVVLDSFGPRRLNGGKACARPLSDTGVDLLIEDAFNALAALRREKRIDGDNIFVTGQSLGGIAAAWTAMHTHRKRENLFRAAVAWYPQCNPLTGGTKLRSPLFDQPGKTRTYRGYTLGYDAGAAADGRKKMLEFFKRYVKKP